MPTPPASIAFVDLKAQQKLIRSKVEARFIAILDHGAYINGPEVKELEDAALRLLPGLMFPKRWRWRWRTAPTP